LKQISVLCHDFENKKVLLGTEGGNIYVLNLANFQIEENIIYQDIVMQNSPDDFKVTSDWNLTFKELSNEKF
jgi:lethal(2) giant larvae protein